MHKTTLILSVALAACGAAKDSVKPSHSAHAHHEHAEGGHEAHAHGPEGSPVAKFHDRLSPLWHAAEGEQRTADTCTAAPELRELGSQIEAEAKQSSTTDYLQRASTLEATVTALHEECDTPERKQLTSKLSAVHDAFHAVAEARGQ